MTRWLDKDEQQTWRRLLAATQLINEALDRQLQRDANMPHAYYVILVRLSEAPGRAMRMSELAASAQSSQSRLSHAVARLEERGWVRRERSPSDRRGNVAVLTDEGYAALAAAAPGHVEEVRRTLFDVLKPEQVRELDEICSAIVSAADGNVSAAGGNTLER
ncbi:DNA-binding MarR family transcriptional regulator [Nonomuraea polychroma]|uniref:DNA-binding MarR family transcriptional regulator n=1 Tax=Nonomuraea polychroma TaxID=46176 RepID=A0A438ML16_9ACTN|nr:MarR family transcriptional regulator [Nonomuraea polychroma]RVX46306.1 DNA-binding MarR family transcriptional regulator [Nonomuraea polychroma]